MGRIYVAVLLLICAANVMCENHSGLFQLNDCTCPGYVQTFECVVSGAGITIWQGTVFHSPCVIKLRHSQYSNSQAIGECNDGVIIASSVGVLGDRYTSQLNVTVGQDTINETIECWYQDNEGIKSIIGSNTLIFTTDPYQPPSDVHLEAINSNRLEFAWNSVPKHCPSFRYIISTDCGVCRNSTSNTSIVCHLSKVRTNSSRVCIFAAKTEICGHMLGEFSENVTVHLSVPSPPEFVALKLHHNYSSNNMMIEVTFNTTHLAISNNIDGSPISYTITYTEFTSGRICDSYTIPAILCHLRNGLCRHIFTISPPCSTDNDTSISVFATNILGDGAYSTPIIFSFISSGSRSNDITRILDDHHSTPAVSNDSFILITGVLSATLAITIVVLAITIINMYLKNKSNTRKCQLSPVSAAQQNKEKSEDENVNYEEINEFHTFTQTKMDISENVAYSTMILNK